MTHNARWYRHRLEQRLAIEVTDLLWDHIRQVADIDEEQSDAEEVEITLDLLEDKARATFAAAGNPLPPREDATMLPPNTGDIRGGAHGAGTASLRLTIGSVNLEPGMEPGMEPSMEPGMLREQVISQLIARDAANDEAVRRFRTEVLADMLLVSADDVRAWITRHAGPMPRKQNMQGKNTPGKKLQDSVHGDPLGPGLAYALHGVKHVERPIGAGGVLDHLRQLSEDLAARFSWTDAQATTFVLTGAVPLIREVGSHIERHPAYPALTRIRLVVSPMVTPKEVAICYEQARAQIVTTRPREPGERQLRLVLFVAAQPAPEAWPTWMSVWNTHVATAGRVEWQYTLLANFKRDAQDTRRRLMAPAYRPTAEKRVIP